MRSAHFILPAGAYFHARPCAQIANAVAGLDCSVFLFCGSQMADAASAVSLMKLGRPEDSTVQLLAEGPDAQEAIERIRKKLQAVFC